MYLLKEAMRFKENGLYRQSYVIDNEKVMYVRERMPYWKKQKVCMNNIVIAPARVGCCSRMISSENKEERRSIEQDWLKQGVTAIAVVQEVQSERMLISEVKAAHEKMNDVSLDYVLGVSVPLKRLKPSLFQICRRLRIPFIQVIITARDTLSNLPWTHFADALVTYPTVLQPLFQDDKKIELTRAWNHYCDNYGLSTAPSMNRWTKELMQKSGIYPQKGELLVGCDADYLLYQQTEVFHLSRQARKLAASTKLDYDKVEPTIVVRRGQILKANQTYYLDGSGKQIIVMKPKRLFSMDYAR